MLIFGAIIGIWVQLVFSIPFDIDKRGVHIGDKIAESFNITGFRYGHCSFDIPHTYISGDLNYDCLARLNGRKKEKP